MFVAGKHRPIPWWQGFPFFCCLWALLFLLLTALGFSIDYVTLQRHLIIMYVAIVAALLLTFWGLHLFVRKRRQGLLRRAVSLDAVTQADYGDILDFVRMNDLHVYRSRKISDTAEQHDLACTEEPFYAHFLFPALFRNLLHYNGSLWLDADAVDALGKTPSRSACPQSFQGDLSPHGRAAWQAAIEALEFSPTRKRLEVWLYRKEHSLSETEAAFAGRNVNRDCRTAESKDVPLLLQRFPDLPLIIP